MLQEKEPVTKEEIFPMPATLPQSPAPNIVGSPTVEL